jgi:hypothetical protein
MSNTNTGGPAFPGPYLNDKGVLEAVAKQGGMTLRDYFAATALQGLITGTSMWREEDDIYLARAAYGLADAMLEAREE